MPLVFITPTRDQVEEELIAKSDELRARVKATIMGISNFPSHDVLVNINHCPIADADPQLADVLVFIDACPGKLEALSGEICEEVARDLAQLGFTAGSAEIWGPRPLPGPWVGIKDNRIYDFVDHPPSLAELHKDP